MIRLAGCATPTFLIDALAAICLLYPFFSPLLSPIFTSFPLDFLFAGSDTVDLSIQFRIITEYVDPNYENIYPEEITRYLDSVSWDAHLGESYFITITGDQTNGYTAALTQ